jgi:hypothetical protein
MLFQLAMLNHMAMLLADSVRGKQKALAQQGVRIFGVAYRFLRLANALARRDQMNATRTVSESGGLPAHYIESGGKRLRPVE